MSNSRQEQIKSLKSTSQEIKKILSLLNIKLGHIEYELNCLDEDDLEERGLVRLCRLTQDVTIVPRYDEGDTGKSRVFARGTLIDADITFPKTTIYLDDDGDGYLDFPSEFLEVVELPKSGIDWENVVTEG